MVTVDYALCTYCGGCVSVCPVDALTLAETRLVVEDVCIDCAKCVTACPVGALRLDDVERAGHSDPVRRHYDLVVVGAGPGGSTAARIGAEAGLSVLLLEKRQEIGSPVRCAEGVGHDALVAFLQPDPRWVSATIDKVEITAFVDGDRKTWRSHDGYGYVLERRVFDRVLAEHAVQAMAEVQVKTAATGLLMDDGRVRGVTIRRSGFPAGSDMTVEAKVVIAADGVEAQLERRAGLSEQLPLRDVMVCAQYLLAGIEIDPTCTCYFIGHELAPGGYGWIFPKGEGRANVGLGVQADLWQAEDLDGETVLSRLIRFIEARPALAMGHPVTLVTGNVPTALPPPRLVTHGFMLVGDAARQVDPLTGGGITNAMLAGQLAAQVAVRGINAGDTSAQLLSDYERLWQRHIGRKMVRNYRLRERFPPDRRTDERFVRAFALAVGG